jgi:6-pyruvoyltetrahydropterin/6-carboxytetrahydropterin synthase
MSKFQIVREIGIDAGHRVPLHGSKCRNLHGHRYKIEAYCAGELIGAGEQSDMVMDFGFLRDAMMRVIDHYCDHGLILCAADPILPNFISSVRSSSGTSELAHSLREKAYWSSLESEMLSIEGTKLYIIEHTPTAEVLAAHWYGRLKSCIEETQGVDLLQRVRVWETPNCHATYPI